VTADHHELTDADLTALATGLGGPAVVAELMSSRLSRHLLLLKYVAEKWREDRPILDAAVAVLADVQQRRPEIYRHLLGDPLVGAWLAHTARHLRRPGAQPTGDLLQLGGLAAVAALRAGVDADLIGHAHRGRVTLPTLGEAVLTDGTDGPVPIRVRRGRALLGSSPTAVPARSPEWLPLRRLTARHADLTCTVRVEDGNPYRDGYHVPPAERLSDGEVESWQELYGQAWELLGRHLPGRAAELGAGLRTLVPLRDDEPGAARSGTARNSVGALGLTRPRSPEDFALTLVHEFQHSKLSAALDLVGLYVPGGAELHFAPWRTDPRPTAGLIQGVYAFLGIADTWRALRAAPALRDLATDEYSTVREQVHAGLAALESSAELTPAGRQFANGLRQALEPMLSEQLPERSVTAGRAALERLRESSGSQQSGRRTTAK
jgi:HEXXH motif-containing protein